MQAAPRVARVALPQQQQPQQQAQQQHQPHLRAALRRAVVAAAAAAAAAAPISGAPPPGAPNAASPASAEIARRSPKDVRVVVAGPTGYIGKFVTKELIARGYQVTALAREKAGIKGKMGKEDTQKEFAGARVVFGDVTSPESIAAAAFDQPADVAVCCLASRTGGKKDSWDIDYAATKHFLDAARAAGCKHFVLLSAICVQKPLLEFQRAKLKLEAELAAAGDITYSIVRPTAFFKSLAGQVKLVQQGKPYVMFGDGALAACKPISEADLARFMADCISDPSKHNCVLPIGGPGGALTAKQQAQILFKLTSLPEKYISAPVWLFDGIIGVLDLLAKAFPSLEVRAARCIACGEARGRGQGEGAACQRTVRPRRRQHHHQHPPTPTPTTTTITSTRTPPSLAASASTTRPSRCSCGTTRRGSTWPTRRPSTAPTPSRRSSRRRSPRASRARSSATRPFSASASRRGRGGE